MNDNLASWRLKIGRAKEHFSALETEIVAWATTNPIKITKEKDGEGRRHALVAEIVNPPSLDRWSLIAGDCIHNLRSALDSLVYGIAVHERSLNPPKDEMQLQFPITSAPDKFNEPRNKRKIRSLSSAVQFEIEELQPYKNPHPEFPPILELLGFLDNCDKHRTLNVVAAVPHSASIYDVIYPPDTTVVLTAYRTTITAKREVLSFTIEPANPSLDYRYEAKIVICVVHPQGPSKSPYSELAKVLMSLIKEVERIVNNLEAIAGPMQSPVSLSRTQSSHFRIDKDGVTVIKPTN